MSNGMPVTGSKPAVAKARAKVQDAIETAASLNSSLQAPGRRPVPKGPPLPGTSSLSSSSTNVASATSSSSSSSSSSSTTTTSSTAVAASASASSVSGAGSAVAGGDDYEASKASAKSSRVLKDEERSMVADLDKWDTGVFALPSDASLDDSF